MKSGDFQATNFAGTDSGLHQASDYIRLGGGGEMRAIGRIKITTPILLGNNCLYRGWGGRSSHILEADPTFAGSYMVSNYDQAGGQQWCAIENMSIWGNKSGGATTTYLIYFKSIGQPSRIRDVSCDAGSSYGIWTEGGATNAGNFLIDNTGVSNCLSGAFVISGISAGYTMRDCDAEFVNAGAALVLIDGPFSGDLFPGTIKIDGLHLEGMLAGSRGVHIKASRNVHVKDLIYFGSGGNGDLIGITGTAAQVQNVIAENITAYVGACANGLVDSVNGYTRASDANGVNISRYEIGSPRWQGSPTIIGNPAITGDLAITGNETVSGTLGVTGAITGSAAATFGTAGVAEVVTVGRGGANAAGADLVVDSGNTGATQSRVLVRRNGQTDLLMAISGTSEQIQFRNALVIGTTAGGQSVQISTDGKIRAGGSGAPSIGWYEAPAGTTAIAPIILTAGTNLTTPLAGAIEFDGTWPYFGLATSKRSLIHVDRKGTDIASAATIAIPSDGDVFHVTGATNITNGITVNASDAGRTVVLIFDSTPTVTATGTSHLNGNFVATASDTLTIKCDGTNWYEMGRSPNV